MIMMARTPVLIRLTSFHIVGIAWDRLVGSALSNRVGTVSMDDAMFGLGRSVNAVGDHV
jgi:hypothetical protein